MKKQFTLCLLLFAICNIKAQYGDNFTFSGGFGLNLQSSSQFNKFKKSYNDFNANNLKHKMRQSAVPFSYQFGAIYWVSDNFGMSLNYSFSRIAFQAEFKDNYTRKMVIKNRTPIDFGLTVGIDDDSYIHGRFGLALSSIISRLEYPDGTVSIGKENALNGVYNTVGFFYKIEYIRTFKKYFGLVAGIGGGGGIGTSYMDGNDAKGTFNSVPTNWNLFTQNRANGTLYDYPAKEVVNMNYFQFNLGIQFQFTTD